MTTPCPRHSDSARIARLFRLLFGFLLLGWHCNECTTNTRSRRLSIFPSVLAAATAFFLNPASGEPGAATAGTGLPQAVTSQDFQALRDRSPFTRSLDLPGTLVLTGVAVMDGSLMASLIDIKGGRTMLVSETPNELGWKLVEVRRTDDLEAAVAIIAMESGETIRAYHDRDLMEVANQRLRFGSGTRVQHLAGRGASDLVPEWVHQMDDPVLKGIVLQTLIEGGAFDAAPFKAVDMALAVSEPRAREPALSAAFGRLGGGVGGVEYNAAVKRLNSLANGRDRDFAINGLAHGLVGRDPKSALKWANSISSEGFRKVVVKNVTRRIEARSSRSGGR